MKTLFPAMFALIAAFPAFATENTVFTCLPAQPNGLGIAKLVLDVSNEDPEATMTVKYRDGGRPEVSSMAYDSDGTRYEFEPNTERDGQLTVLLVKKSGRWFATVRSANIDTFSALECRAN